MRAFEQLDGHAGLRNALRHLADERHEWAGIPLPLDGRPLVIEPTYPNAEKIMSIGRGKDEDEPDPYAGAKIRNQFWSSKKGRDVIIWEHEGKIIWGTGTTVHSLPFLINTLGSADAWGIEQEANAVHLLGELVKHRAFKQYMLTGMFLETSRRSGVTYLFRRLRPTLALRPEKNRILAALCLHPIGYYADSWAGALCPTDDVIAHLALMRADEPLFWRRCNQHSPRRPEAGL